MKLNIGMALGNQIILCYGTLGKRSRIEFHADFMGNVPNGDSFQITLSVTKLLARRRLGMIVDNCVEAIYPQYNQVNNKIKDPIVRL